MLRSLLLVGLCLLAGCEREDSAVPTAQIAEPVPEPPQAGNSTQRESAGGAEPAAPQETQEQAPVSIGLYNEGAYQNENGDWMLDVIAGQLVFIDVILVDREEIPVPDQPLKIQSSSNSALIGADRSTDANGSLQFAVRPVQQGEDRISVAWGGVQQEILLNVLSDEALQWQGMDAAEGVIPWETLLGSRVTYLEDAIRIDFSEDVRALDDQEISVIGFIMPLESTDRQQHFLLVSTPPSCFFHLPGGPVGAIEVFAEEGLEFGWGPVRLKGRFKLYAPQEYGAVYRLHEARQMSLDS